MLRIWRPIGITAVWRRGNLATPGARLLLAFAASFHLGCASGPPDSVDLSSSTLLDIPRDDLEVKVRADLERLKTIADGIEDLTRRAGVFSAVLDKKRNAEKRDYYLPEEGDEIRSMFGSFLAYRAALLRLLATYAGFDSVPDRDTRARCFMVSYAAAITGFEYSLKLVNTYGDDDGARRKLDEPEPNWDIPDKMFTTVYNNVSSSWNIKTVEEMAAYFATHRADWRREAVWPAASFDWVEQRIDHGISYVRQHTVAPEEAWFSRLMDRMKDGAHVPAYRIQSVVSEWIGDTRVSWRKPLITIQQIEEIEQLLEPGDIFLERRTWYLSNAFLPGFWPHAALYVGRLEDLRELGIADRPEIRNKLDEYLAKAPDGHDHTVIEAVSEGVIFNSLTHSMHADYVAVLRPRLTDQEIGEAIVRAFSHTGKPYDFEFDFFSNDKLVCTEVVYRSYQGSLDFTPLPKVMGRRTLPAVEIARKFVKERDEEDRDLDFVLFLDRDAGAKGARLASEDEFCGSAERSRSSIGR
ncbi:MAG: YiiX/YebB-like N1pC/P60 family cysteine hydrolase [Planctomycetota bacterium]|jgi:hypothetical protein